MPPKKNNLNISGSHSSCYSQLSALPTKKVIQYIISKKEQYPPSKKVKCASCFFVQLKFKFMRDITKWHNTLDVIYRCKFSQRKSCMQKPESRREEKKNVTNDGCYATVTVYFSWKCACNHVFSCFRECHFVRHTPQADDFIWIGGLWLILNLRNWLEKILPANENEQFQSNQLNMIVNVI